MTDPTAVGASGNRWLASLPVADLNLLIPHLSSVSFDRGQTLFDTGEDVGRVFFPTEGVVSMLTVLSDGQMVETAAIGREGLIGATCGPLNGAAVSRAVTQTPGAAMSIGADRFSEALDGSEALRAAVSRHTEALLAQVQQTAACNALHRLDSRLARWLLMLHDRSDGDSFRLTHESLSEMLGVRRATVSEVGAALEDKGLIRRGRGRIEVLDRDGLERAACECYRTISETMAALLASPAKP